jgi:hypothetical protein
VNFLSLPSGDVFPPVMENIDKNRGAVFDELVEEAQKLKLGH